MGYVCTNTIQQQLGKGWGFSFPCTAIWGRTNRQVKRGQAAVLLLLQAAIACVKQVTMGKKVGNAGILSLPAAGEVLLQQAGGRQGAWPSSSPPPALCGVGVCKGGRYWACVSQHKGLPNAC